MKNSMLKALEELIEGDEQNEQGPLQANTNHTLTVKGLCSNSTMEIAKQLAYTAVQETKDGTIESYLHVIFSLFSAYQRAHPAVLTTVYSIIHHIIRKQCRESSIQYAEILNDTAYETYKYHTGDMQSYKKYYPELYILDERQTRLGNKEGLLMFNNLVQYYLSNLAPATTFTVANYSEAVLSGKLTDDFAEYPILKYCLRYLTVIDEFIHKSIERCANNLDNRTACNMFQLLSWRDRFLKLANESIFVGNEASRRKILREDIVPLLYTHSKWLQKHLMIPIMRLAIDGDTLINNFNKAAENIVMQAEDDNSTLTKLSKKIRKMYGQPKLLLDQEEFEKCSEKSKVYNKMTLDLNQPLSKQLNRLSVDNYAVTDGHLALDVPNSDKLEQAQQNITKLVDSKVVVKPGSEVKLLPIVSYIVQRILTILQRDFFEVVSQLIKNDDKVIVRIESTDVLMSLVHLGKVTKGFPPALLNLLEVLVKLQDSSQDKISDR